MSDDYSQEFGDPNAVSNGDHDVDEDPSNSSGDPQDDDLLEDPNEDENHEGVCDDVPKIPAGRKKALPAMEGRYKISEVQATALAEVNSLGFMPKALYQSRICETPVGLCSSLT